MEFIIDNYIWFIVGGVVFIMAIIGYIADKTNFGRDMIAKEPKPKKVKPVKETKKTEKIEVEDKGIGEMTQTFVETPKEETLQPISEDLYAPLNEATPQPISEDLYAPLNEVNPQPVSEDLYAPLNEVNVETVSENLNPTLTEGTLNNVEQDLYQPLPDHVEAVVKEDEVSEEFSNDEIIPVVTDSLIENTEQEPVVIDEPVANEEDIWKF